MKHQIALVGGQLLPIYQGIKEYDPSDIHFIVSKESKNRIEPLKRLLQQKNITEHFCDPYDFTSTVNCIKDVLATIDSNNLQINLTGGTKIMFLAAQSLIQQQGLKGFYINQSNSILSVPNFDQSMLTYDLTIQEYFGLSGHILSRAKRLSDYTSVEQNEVEKIERFILDNNTLYSKINKALRKIINVGSLPKKGNVLIDDVLVDWDNDNIEIVKDKTSLLRLSSKSSRALFFYAGWWEYKVAQTIAKWGKAKELLLQCEIPHRDGSNIQKNEIDVLVNVGKKLIFIECKSGNVTSADINKMKTVKDLYGGLISKTILVTRFKPSAGILERCDEFDIDVFFLYDDKIETNRIDDITTLLHTLESKLSI